MARPQPVRGPVAPWLGLLCLLLLSPIGCPADDDVGDDDIDGDDTTGDDDSTGDDDTSGDDDSTADDDSAGDDDTTAPPEPPILLAIDPLSGPQAGGTEIELTGEHLDGPGGVRVHFGALDATVVSAEPQRIVALSPPLEPCMTLDTTVLHDGGIAVLTNSYTGCDTFAGATGAIARHGRTRILDGSVPGLSDVEGVSSWAMAITPASYSPDDDHPGDGCVRDFTPPAPLLTPRNAGEQVRFTAPGGDVALVSDGSGGFAASGGLDGWSSSTEYAVAFEGGPGFAVEEVAGALVTPDADFTVTPALDDWQGTTVSLGGSLLVEIDGGTAADRLLVWIEFHDGAGQPAGNLVCTFEEGAIPLVSPAYLAGLPAGHAVVRVSRQSRRDRTLADGSTLAGDARATVVGGWTVEP